MLWGEKRETIGKDESSLTFFFLDQHAALNAFNSLNMHLLGEKHLLLKAIMKTT